MGYGTCWKAGTPRLCRSNWVLDQWLPVRLIDEFSDQRAWWWDAFNNAMWAWNDADGPQMLHWAPQTNDTWVYVRDQASTPGWAITSNCNTAGVCFSYMVAINIWYSNIDIDRGIFRFTSTNSNGCLRASTATLLVSPTMTTQRR